MEMIMIRKKAQTLKTKKTFEQNYWKTFSYFSDFNRPKTQTSYNVESHVRGKFIVHHEHDSYLVNDLI